MSDDHTAVIKQAVALVTRLGVTPKGKAVRCGNVLGKIFTEKM